MKNRFTLTNLKARLSAACRAAALITVLLLNACAAPAADVPPTPAPAVTPAEQGAVPPGPNGTAAPVESGDVTIANVTVVDVEQGVLIPDQTVVIAGERIVKIAPSAQVAAIHGSRLLDGHGLYLMPGLVDAHVHDFDPEVFGRALLANGITLVRDMGQLTAQALELREQANRGEHPWPEMLVTGTILDGNPPQIPEISLGLRTVAEARQAVREQAAAGVDQIKVYADLDLDLLQAIVEEAHGLGLKVVGHVPEAIYLEDAVAAGQDEIEHLHGFDKVVGKLLGQPITLMHGVQGVDARYWLRMAEVDRAALQIMLRRVAAAGVAVCPTVVVFKMGVHFQTAIAGEHDGREYISPGIRAVWRDKWGSQGDIPAPIWQGMAAFVRELHAAGVTLLVGTDLLVPGVIPGFAVHEEMAIWQDAGIPAADVLRSATILPARSMGLDERLGTVAEGKLASLVLTRANPLEDIRNAQQVEAVFLRGKYFDRAGLDQLLAEARELAK